MYRPGCSAPCALELDGDIPCYHDVGGGQGDRAMLQCLPDLLGKPHQSRTGHLVDTRSIRTQYTIWAP